MLLLACVQIIIHYIPPRTAVYAFENVPRPLPTPLSQEELDTRIDLNTATFDQLITLPGIGEVTAERILIFRKERGRFRYVEDLLFVRGIGEKKLSGLRDLVYVLPQNHQ